MIKDINYISKKLVYLGREYPAGYHDFFRPKLKAAFLKKKDLTDEKEILKSIQFGEYIIKGKYVLFFFLKIDTFSHTHVFRIRNDVLFEKIPCLT